MRALWPFGLKGYAFLSLPLAQGIFSLAHDSHAYVFLVLPCLSRSGLQFRCGFVFRCFVRIVEMSGLPHLLPALYGRGGGVRIVVILQARLRWHRLQYQHLL